MHEIKYKFVTEDQSYKFFTSCINDSSMPTMKYKTNDKEIIVCMRIPDAKILNKLEEMYDKACN